MWIVRTTIIFFFLTSTLLAKSEFRDHQFWTRTDLGIKVGDDKVLYAFHGLRFVDNASRLGFQFFEMGIVFRVRDDLRVIPSFREGLINRENQWIPEENPRFTVTKVWKVKNFLLGNRARLEYRSRRDNFLFRNQFIVNFPAIIEDKVTPYIKDELFFDKIMNLSRNRLRMGGKLVMTDHIFLLADFTFQWNKINRDLWSRDDIVRLNLDFLY